MESNTHTMFDELLKRFDEFDTKWEKGFSEAEDAQREQNDTMESQILSLEAF